MSVKHLDASASWPHLQFQRRLHPLKEVLDKIPARQMSLLTVKKKKAFIGDMTRTFAVLDRGACFQPRINHRQPLFTPAFAKNP